MCTDMQICKEQTGKSELSNQSHTYTTLIFMNSMKSASDDHSQEQLCSWEGGFSDAESK